MRLRRARVGGELGQGIFRSLDERSERVGVFTARRCLYPTHHIDSPWTDPLDCFGHIRSVQAPGEDHPMTLR